jgi:hypothetical protein
MSAAKDFVNGVEIASRRCAADSQVLTQDDLEGWGLCNVTLRPYQLDGVRWLVERRSGGLGCILGDEMGLGKTLQVNFSHCRFDYI